MLRICPSVPITWRSGTCLQFGVEDPVLIDGLLPSDASLIDDLRMGLGSAQFHARAQELGVDLARAASLVSLLQEAGVLIPENADAAAVTKSPGILATSRLFRRSPDSVANALSHRPICVLGPLRSILAHHLTLAGFAVSPVDRVDDLDLLSRPIAVTSSHLVPDLHTATWLVDREVDHCQIVCQEFSVEVIGLVRPGATACTVCRSLALKDEDEGWFDQYPQIRALPGRADLSDPVGPVIAASHAVVLLRRALLGCAEAPVRRRIDLLTGLPTDEELDYHPRCHCRVPVPQLESLGEEAQ